MNQRKRFFGFLGFLLVLGAIYYWVATPHSHDLLLVGTVDANQVVVSSKILGRIEKLNVDEGQDVKAGDLIATIDSDQWQAQQQSAEAQLASLRSQVASNTATAASTSGDTSNQVVTARANMQGARAALREAEANLQLQTVNAKRIVSLAGQGVASQQERDQAESSLAAQEAHVQAARDQVAASEAALQQALARTNQAKAAQSNVAATRGQVQSAQAQLAQSAIQVGYTKIYAPVSGKVSVRVAREGEVVNPGSPIVTLIDLTQTWVYAPVPETYADTIQLGDQLTVRLLSGATLKGKVIAKAAEGDFATQRDVSRSKRDIKAIQLKLLVPNPNESLVPGMTAEVLIPPGQLAHTNHTQAAEVQSK